MESEVSYTPITRAWFKVNYSKLETGGLRSTVFTLASSTIGAGLFALPYILSKAGLLLGLGLFLAMGCLFGLYSYLLLSVAYRAGQFDLISLCHCKLGYTARRLTEVATMGLCFGVGTAYVVLVSTICWSLLVTAQLLPPTSFATAYPYTVLALTVFFWLPTTIQYKLQRVGSLALLSLISSVFIACFVVIQLPLYLQEGPGPLVWAEFDTSLLTTGGVLFFAFNNAHNIIQICSRLERSTLSRVRKGIVQSYFVVTAMYAVLGAASYLAYADASPEVLLFRPVIDGTPVFEDWPMVVARIMVGVYLAVAAAQDFSTLRYSVERFVGGREHCRLRHCVVTLVILLLACCVAIFKPRVLTYFAVIGGFFASTLSFLVPALLYNADRRRFKSSVLAGGVLLWLVGVACGLYQMSLL